MHFSISFVYLLPPYHLLYDLFHYYYKNLLLCKHNEINEAQVQPVFDKKPQRLFPVAVEPLINRHFFLIAFTSYVA